MSADTSQVKPGQPKKRLAVIPGDVPDLRAPLRGCRFVSRCSEAIEQCRTQEPPMQQLTPARSAACWLATASG